MFYVYVYFNPLKPSITSNCGFEPFYVGKGKGKRHLYHFKQTALSNEKNRHKANTILAIQKSGMQPIVELVKFTEYEVEAYVEEKRLIALWGRADLGKGPLTNLTDGGEGPAGKVTKEKTKQLLSKAAMLAYKEGRLKIDPEHVQKWILASRTPEAIAKSANSRRGKERSETTKLKIKTARAKWIATLDADERKQKLGTMRGKKHPFTSSNGVNPTAKKVEYNGIIYESVTAAVQSTGIHKRKLKSLSSFKYL